MKRAFTLIELLVVIVIIAVLAAILFPVFAKARERARMAQCISNLHQIGAAMGMYLQDWNGVYPAAYTGYKVSTDILARPSLPQAMKAYVTDQKIWQCPSDIGEIFPLAEDGWKRRTPPFRSETWAMSSYDYLGLGLPKKGYGRIGGYPSSIVKQPTLAVLSYEPRPWHDTYDPSLTTRFTETSLLYNVLYCDYHMARRTHVQWDTDAVRGLR